MIAKADKGSCILFLTLENYDNKINNFITQNHFLTINTDPTNSFQITTRKITNSSRILVPQENKRKYLELNPSPPTIK
jgi:tRNA(Glu) U13 pseudouridine synthase TruD